MPGSRSSSVSFAGSGRNSAKSRGSCGTITTNNSTKSKGKAAPKARCKTTFGDVGEQFKRPESVWIKDFNDPFEDKGLLRGTIIKCLHTPVFEYAMGALIMSNVFVMIVEIDNTTDLEEANEFTEQWTEAYGWCALLIFAGELALRLFAFRSNYFMDAWNIFDFLIVSIDVLVSLLALIFRQAFPVSVLRVFRLAKLARVCKVLRVFPELRLLLSCILSALSAIFWGAVLLALVVLGWAMAAVCFIHPLNKDIDYGECERCARAYSSVMASALTIWRQIVAGDSWGQDTIPLVERYPATVLFFIPLFLTVGMTVLSLILGMIVSVAMTTKDDIKEVDGAQSAAIKLEKQSNLLKLCKEMDTDNSGDVSQDELAVAFDEPGEFRDSMELLGISRDDFDVIWALMDTENTGSVCYKQLVSRLYGLKTSNTQFTLAYLKYHITLIRDMLQGTMEEEHEELKTEENLIEKELKRMRETGDKMLERQDQLLERLQGPAACPAPEHGHQGAHDSPEKEHKCLGKIGLAKAAQLPEDAEGGCQIEVLFEKLFLALEKEYIFNGSSAKAAAGEMSEAAEGREPKTQASSNEPLLALRRHLTTHVDGSQGGVLAKVLDDVQILFQTICHDVEMLRSEVSEKMRSVDRKLGSTGIQHLSALESPSPLDLVVVPDKASASYSRFCRCN